MSKCGHLDFTNTRLSRQWHLHAPVGDQYVGINAVGAWQAGEMGRPEVKVVVFDTGVDIDHPNLRRNLDLEAARDFDHGLETDGLALSPDEIEALSAGRLDGTKTKAKICNPFDAHGTACAGIVAAHPIRGGCVGVAPRCRIVPVRITTNFEFKSLIAALKYAAWLDSDYAASARSNKGEEALKANGTIRVVILMPRSLPRVAPDREAADAGPTPDELWARLKGAQGEEFWRIFEQAEAKGPLLEAKLSQVLEAAIRDIAKRVPIVCASGNNGTAELIYPACLDETIAVGACNEKGYRATYSQYGAGLDVVAVSSDIPEFTTKMKRLSKAMLQDRGEMTEAMLAQSGPGGGCSQELEDIFERFGVHRLGRLGIETTDHHGPYGYNPNPPGDYCAAAGVAGRQPEGAAATHGPFSVAGARHVHDRGVAEPAALFDHLGAAFAELQAEAEEAEAERPDWVADDFRFGGTSAAAAQVAGVIALMLSKSRTLTPARIKGILHETSSRRPHLKPEPGAGEKPDARAEAEFGYGLVDAAAAVAATPESR